MMFACLFLFLEIHPAGYFPQQPALKSLAGVRRTRPTAVLPEVFKIANVLLPAARRRKQIGM